MTRLIVIRVGFQSGLNIPVKVDPRSPAFRASSSFVIRPSSTASWALKTSFSMAFMAALYHDEA